MTLVSEGIFPGDKTPCRLKGCHGIRHGSVKIQGVYGKPSGVQYDQKVESACQSPRGALKATYLGR